MFIKLNFLNGLGHFNERIVKISRIKEVRPNHNGYKTKAKVLMDRDTRFMDVQETVDEIFGIIKPKTKGTDK